jgi:transposase
MIAVGVDTHKDKHHAVALDRLGQLLTEIVITTDLAGYTQFASWISDLGGQVLVGIEGAGSYGAGLCEYLQQEGIEVFEVERPRRRERRTGKSDHIDALLAAKKVLAGEGLSTPRGTGQRAALQMLLVAHRSLVSERSRLYNTMQALQISAPNALRERIGQVKGGAKLAERLTGMRTRPTASLQENTTLEVLRDMANRARALDAQAKAYALEIETLARSLAPKLLEEPGVGPICAGKLLAFNPARFTSEAAFARANGTAPQPASSGKTVRHRLSRGGDRQINTAIYTIALSRSVHHAPSRAYIQRRASNGFAGDLIGRPSIGSYPAGTIQGHERAASSRRWRKAPDDRQLAGARPDLLEVRGGQLGHRRASPADR